MHIPFTKLHGNGNDFILIDETAGTVIPEEMKPGFAALYCDRRFGIGGDGVLFLLPSETADVRIAPLPAGRERGRDVRVPDAVPREIPRHDSG
mgnify:CR=1 FL=1